eukprot:1709469-Amphidinium_carterae.1
MEQELEEQARELQRIKGGLRGCRDDELDARSQSSNSGACSCHLLLLLGKAQMWKYIDEIEAH